MYFAIRSEKVLTPTGWQKATITIENGTILAVESGDSSGAEDVVDVGNRVVMPGLVDSHVHINEPGRTEWEGFATATKAAAAGGITTIVDMPLNSSPVTTTLAAFQQKCQAAVGKLAVDCGFYAGVIPGNVSQLPALIEAGVLAAKAFMVHSGIDDFPAATLETLREAMPVLAAHDIPLLVHAELATPVDTDLANSPRSYEQYAASRPCRWEDDAIAALIELCRNTGCRVHIVHLAAASSLSLLQKARAEGLPISVETCPHYLYFSAEGIADGNTLFKCAPPIRDRENSQALWRGLEQGIIDFIASDHSPCPPSLKLLESGDFHRAWGGISSLQLMLPIIWTIARQRDIDLGKIAQWLSQRPAELVGLSGSKGQIAPGYDADLIVFDPEVAFTVEPSMLHHRHKKTPYDGEELWGIVEQTYLRGYRVYDKGNFTTVAGKILLHRQK